MALVVAVLLALLRTPGRAELGSHSGMGSHRLELLVKEGLVRESGRDSLDEILCSSCLASRWSLVGRYEVWR